MLVEPKLKILHDLVQSSTKDEMVWIHGYLSGIIATGNNIQEDADLVLPTVKKVNQKITVAYGTETGNSKKIATDLVAHLKKTGSITKLVSLDQYRLNDLVKEEYLFIIISTHGDGEPPAAAKKFYEHVYSQSLHLNKLKYAVLALGDSAYPLFCKAGDDVDVRLLQLGATRLTEIEKCDIDFESNVAAWISRVLKSVNNEPQPASSVTVPAIKKSTGKKIYNGSVLANINLNDTGSAKQTHHIEISADAVLYQPGDSLGIVPKNPLHLVEEIFQLTRIHPEHAVTFQNQLVTVQKLLTEKLSIIYLPERVVKKYASIVQQDIPETRMGLIDLLKIYPVKDAAQFEEVIGILEPITPRLYSISSSPLAHDGEVHVTIARDTFYINDECKYGLCSNYLVELEEDSSVDFYIHPNNQFRLPAEDADVIMIGPGTGVAPFRSFLAERDASGASGRNWLFFGDQHFTTDFLYQTDIQNWFNTGLLTNVDVAFSRDQQQKLYVQHKMIQKGAAFFEWLSGGATVYVCGAKSPMSDDVETAILQIIALHGNKTEEEALNYLNDLKNEGRYVKDVY